MSSPDFDTAIATYDLAVTTLEKLGEPSAEDGLAVLTGRDRVQVVVESANSTASLIQLIHLDQRLRKLQDKLVKTVDLEAYRTSLKPSEDAWWWYLEPSTHRLDRFDWVWQAATLVLLTPSVSLIVDISTKFLGSVPDTFGSFAIVGQSALALLTGGALTDQGRKIIQTILTSLRIPRYLWRETQALMSLVLLVSLLGFRFSLPLIARGYLEKGDVEYDRGKFASAESNYNRALDLWPQMVTCNARLGALYEDLGELDKAKEQYRLAVQGGNAIAFNNLARLYNLEGKYTEAFRLLWSGKNMPEVENDPQLKVSWYKNMGWARYGQERYDDAEAFLSKAITEANQLEESQQELSSQQIDDKNQLSTSAISTPSHSLGSAYCLRAQVYTKLKKTDRVTADWEGCSTYANPSLPEADQWIGLAQSYERSQSELGVDRTKPQGVER